MLDRTFVQRGAQFGSRRTYVQRTVKQTTGIGCRYRGRANSLRSAVFERRSAARLVRSARLAAGQLVVRHLVTGFNNKSTLLGEVDKQVHSVLTTTII